MSAKPHPLAEADADAPTWIDKLPPGRWEEIVSQLNFNAFVEPMRKLRREMEAAAPEPASQPITKHEEDRETSKVG